MGKRTVLLIVVFYNKICALSSKMHKKIEISMGSSTVKKSSGGEAAHALRIEAENGIDIA